MVIGNWAERSGGIGNWELGIGRSEAEGLAKQGIGRSEAEGLGIGQQSTVNS
ncbi:hypothetical protein [Microcoleus sp. B4-D4]|uniref:hypothetical protein n=1 Tax=Microcoleus sp. B4-D4 TaxID=2818667 RepID=UPI002FD6E55D